MASCKGDLLLLIAIVLLSCQLNHFVAAEIVNEMVPEPVYPLCEAFPVISNSNSGNSVKSYLVSTPNYPNHYDTGSHCQWMVPETDDTSYIQVSVSFPHPIDIEDSSNCTKDAIDLLQNGVVVNSFCGEHITPANGSYDGPIAVHFRSDSEVTGAGGEILVSVIEGPYILSGTGDAVYTRWGKPSCGLARGNNLLPHGYGYAVSLGNVLECVDKNIAGPINGSVDPNAPAMGYARFNTANEPGRFKHFHNQSISCAVCHVRLNSVTTVVGENKCPSDWDPMYNGYMMTISSSGGSNMQSICLDHSPFDNANETPTDSPHTRHSVLLEATLLSWHTNKPVHCSVCAANRPKRGMPARHLCESLRNDPDTCANKYAPKEDDYK